MRAETTLRANTDPLQRLLPALPAPLGNHIGRPPHPPLHLLLVLQRRKLGANDPEDNILVLRQEFEGLEATGPLGVVLKIECLDVEVLKELLSDDVVSSLGKVAASDEVSATQVNARMQVLWETGQAVIVECDVGVEEVLHRTDIVRVRRPAVAELL